MTQAERQATPLESLPPERFDVSVVIPARDVRAYVVNAIDSVLAQTLPAAEVVVVDDGSTDGTAEAILANYGHHREVRVVRGHFGSAGAARNAGWRIASHAWVAFLDADDIWYPEKLAEAAEAIRAFPMAGWFFSDGTFQSLDGAERKSWLSAYADLPQPYIGHPVAELLEVNFILMSSVIVRRALLESLGGFDPRMTHAEDVDLWIRLAMRAPVTAVEKPLVHYQHRQGSLTRQIERRLMGDVDLYHRLAVEPRLPQALRRRARHREAMAYFKLAFAALRTGDRHGTWSRLSKAWMFPERAVPVAGLAIASLLPTGLLRRMAVGGIGGHAAAQRAFALSRVTLQSDSALLESARRRGAA
jgi:glycosyltransferase involved in cell wall biosynthesis